MEITLPQNFDPNQRPFQADVLSNPARFKFLKIHRKAGKTALAINQGIIESNTIPGVYWYMGPTYRQAKETVWTEPDMLDKFSPRQLIRKKNESSLAITWVKGGVFEIKGADKPDSHRGPNPKGVILDEAYLMKKEIWTEILKPISIANPDMWIWIIGTPKPMGAFWHELYQDFERRMKEGDPDYYVLTLDAESSGILTAKQLNEARTTMTQQAFEQEFMCKWFGDGGVVFRGIGNVIYGPLDTEKEAMREWGLDLAKHVDWTVLVGINRYTYRVDAFDRYNQIDWVLQKARIEAYYRRYGAGRLKMDSTGVGDPIFDDLDKAGLNVEGFKFTETFKRDIITNLAMGIEQGLIFLPEIPELVQEFNNFGYSISKAGRITYGAPEGYHDDIVIAIALAWWDISSRIGSFKSQASNLLNTKNTTRKMIQRGDDSE